MKKSLKNILGKALFVGTLLVATMGMSSLVSAAVTSTWYDMGKLTNAAGLAADNEFAFSDKANSHEVKNANAGGTVKQMETTAGFKATASVTFATSGDGNAYTTTGVSLPSGTGGVVSFVVPAGFKAEVYGNEVDASTLKGKKAFTMKDASGANLPNSSIVASTNGSGTAFASATAICYAKGVYENKSDVAVTVYCTVASNRMGVGGILIYGEAAPVGGPVFPVGFNTASQAGTVGGDATITATGATYSLIATNLAATYTAETEIDDQFSILADTTNTVTVDGSNKTCGGESYTQRLKLGGAGNFDYRSVKITVDSPSRLVLHGTSSSSGAIRNLSIDKADGTVIESEFATNSGSTVDGYVAYLPTAGTYYLHSNSGGYNIYGIYIFANQTSDIKTLPTITSFTSEVVDGNLVLTATINGDFDFTINQLGLLYGKDGDAAITDVEVYNYGGDAENGYFFIIKGNNVDLKAQAYLVFDNDGTETTRYSDVVTNIVE